MKRIAVPTQSAEDWKRLLAKPDLHWKAGCSAMTLAQSWETAHPSVPPEVATALDSTGDPVLRSLELLLAIPEYQVDLPGGQRPSQTDVLALMRGSVGLVAVAVEGKVDEAFGPTVGEKRAETSAGVDERLAWLISYLGLDSVPDSIRYQLLHRTASAMLVAQRFDAAAAVMLVHSFSPTDRWFGDFAAFAGLFDVRAELDHVSQISVIDGRPLFIGWSKGDQRFRERV
ncbi:MAG: hypothetical protein U1E22_04020 [Coriobacteriia bacterium]|nr:hypothetical protein [Coriobacteriia bacterium]